MIQELFGGGATNFISGERKISINGGGPVLLPPTLPSSLPSSSSSSTHTSTAAAAAAAPASSENLRCPRCDSSNTKFCYYNNYNLTQPRHFCKTCRRYWTKGGALRNIPIGGGCRKNRNVNGVSNSAAAKNGSSATASKMKAVASELGRSTGLGPGELLSSGPILWGSPQNTHLLALLRASQNQNPNPNPSSVSLNPITTVKDEGNLMGSSQPYMVTHEPLNHRALGFDGSVGGHVVPSLGLCTSMWRNTTQDQHHQNSGYVLGQHHQGSGIQELYHKFRSSSSSSGSYCGDNSPMFIGNMASSSSSSLSSILESSSVAGGGTELGCWNIPSLPWSSDLPTTNGAYP